MVTEKRRIPTIVPELASRNLTVEQLRELYLRSLRRQRERLSVVLVNLERDAGQNVGALSHVFVLFRLMKERGISQAYLSVLTACYWTSRQKYKIRQKHIRRITGLAPEATVQNFQRLIRDGHLESHGKRGKGRWFTMTHKGKIHATDIFHQLYMRIVDFYDQKNPVTESAGLFGGIEKRNQTL